MRTDNIKLAFISEDPLLLIRALEIAMEDHRLLYGDGPGISLPKIDVYPSLQELTHEIQIAASQLEAKGRICSQELIDFGRQVMEIPMSSCKQFEPKHQFKKGKNTALNRVICKPGYC